MTWICGKDGLKVPDGERCPVCKQRGRGGAPGPQHVCGKDQSTCSECEGGKRADDQV